MKLKLEEMKALVILRIRKIELTIIKIRITKSPKLNRASPISNDIVSILN